MNTEERMAKNSALARRLAGESFVLLKNDDSLLPFGAGDKIAVFGVGQVNTVKGGIGSGEVNNIKNINILDGLRSAPEISVDEELAAVYADAAKKAVIPRSGLLSIQSNCYKEFVPDAQLIGAAAARNTAALIVITRIAGEGADMAYVGGTIKLSDGEIALINAVGEEFDNIVLLLNTPGYVEIGDVLPKIKSVLFIGLPGQEGGSAVADVLTGAVVPTGKLSDTWPLSYTDYSFAGSYSTYMPNGNMLNARGVTVEQTEAPYHDDIFVGYRYFDTFGKAVLYPFGFGLGYGETEIQNAVVEVQGYRVLATAEIVNQSAKYAACDVMQVYVSAPQGRLNKPYQSLVAYHKSGLLQPGESELSTVSFPLADMASYDTEKAAYILERGYYFIRVGNSSRNTRIAGAVYIPEDIVTLQLKNCLGKVPEGFELLSNSGVSPISYAGEEDEKQAAKAAAISVSPGAVPTQAVEYSGEYVPAEPVKGITLKDVADGKYTCAQLAASMDASDLCRLVCGQGMDFSGFENFGEQEKKNNSDPENDTFMAAIRAFIGDAKFEVPGEAGQSPDMRKGYGIPPVILADGPAGVRLTRDVKVNDEVAYHQYCTAFPTGSILACSFDPMLLEEMGLAAGEEMAEYKVDLWLAPGMNIHRSPLCGRNFEYYSEDPLLSGNCGAAITKGVQRTGGGTTLKHFAGNNQEFMRGQSNDIVSERAMREIYLRGFEIAVKAAYPKSIMTAYNDINGVPCADNKDLCTYILRDEWGFDGFVMTDWGGGNSNPAISMYAGNDMIQPGGPKYIKAIYDAVESGKELVSGGTARVPVRISRADVEECAARILGVILRSNAWTREEE